MTLTSTGGYTSIFKDGKLKPGVYKIQNIASQTYVDLQEHTRELYCRPATVLEGKGLVGSLPRSAHIAVIATIFSGKFTLWVPGIAYIRCSLNCISIRLGCTGRHNSQHEPGKPEQYCVALRRLTDGSGRGPVSVSPFPVAWRLEVARDERYRGCEYIR